VIRVSTLIATAAIFAALTYGQTANAVEGIFKLEPVSPQPDAEELEQGLHVKYISREVRWLREAEEWLSHAKPGEPLTGLSYEDTAKGSLTSGAKTYVIADIDGYMNFPDAGSYWLGVQSNDGISLSLSGVEVLRIDGRQACGEKVDEVVVTVPSGGWYKLDVLWFQRRGSSCLQVFWEKGSSPNDPDAVPDEMFAYSPQ
jgi:hypothetical protein